MEVWKREQLRVGQERGKLGARTELEVPLIKKFFFLQMKLLMMPGIPPEKSQDQILWKANFFLSTITKSIWFYQTFFFFLKKSFTSSRQYLMVPIHIAPLRFVSLACIKVAFSLFAATPTTSSTNINTNMCLC